MTHRNGVTLTEVLVAIFIMGIGLLSLLSLFPIGALNMAAAVKDERTANAARNAAAIAQLLNIRDDNNVFPCYTNTEHPSYPPTLLPFPSSGGPSYPVYVDPQGVASGSTRMGILSGVSPGFARVAPPTISTQKDRVYWTTVLDEMLFDDQGAAKLNPPVPGIGMVQREPRYSVAFLCQQVRAYTTNPPPTPYPMGTPPPYSSPHGVDLTIVVYSRRPNFTVAGVPVEEKCYQATFTAGSNLATLTWPAGTPTPAIRRGTWILDATVLGVPTPHGFFYRVANLTPLGSNTLELELQQNARASALSGVAVVMDSVAEVFYKGTN